MGENPISQGSMCGLPSLIHSTVLHLLYDSALKALPNLFTHTHIHSHWHRETQTHISKVKAIVELRSRASWGKDVSSVCLAIWLIFQFTKFPRHLISRNVNRANSNCHTCPLLYSTLHILRSLTSGCSGYLSKKKTTASPCRPTYFTYCPFLPLLAFSSETTVAVFIYGFGQFWRELRWQRHGNDRPAVRYLCLINSTLLKIIYEAGLCA